MLTGPADIEAESRKHPRTTPAQGTREKATADGADRRVAGKGPVMTEMTATDETPDNFECTMSRAPVRIAATPAIATWTAPYLVVPTATAMIDLTPTPATGKKLHSPATPPIAPIPATVTANLIGT